MSRQIVQRIFKLFLFATAIQIAAATVTMEHIQASYEQLNEKLDELQRKLNLIDYCDFSESLQILERHHREKMESLKILERQEKETTEVIQKMEGHQKKTIESLQILERQEKETSEYLKKFEERQKETTEALKNLERRENETSESLKQFEGRQKETAASLQVLESDQKESLHTLERHQNETTASLQILGHQGTETTEALKKLVDHQNETAASLQILERHHNESTPLPSSCVEVFNGAHRKNGVYEIDLPNSDLGPFEVYCLEDPKGGLPWTVVQRRVDGSTDFYRDWSDYKMTFGNLSTNFFIGLDKLHELTSHNGPQELWVKLTDNVTANAYYTRFAIANEDEKYSINILGGYSGDAGDSLIHHGGMKFSTRDADNDKWSAGNCAQTHKGAWWYKTCHNSNLNGVYGSTKFGEGVNWKHFRGKRVSMKYAHMAIRPARK